MENDLLHELNSLLHEVELYLLPRVGSHLAGRVIDIRHTEPPIDGARGLTLKSDNGTGAVVWLHPVLDDENRMQVFLHECAHAKLHFAGLAKVSDLARVVEVRDQEGEYIPERVLAARYKAHEQRETEARYQADKWSDQVKSERGNIRKLLNLLR